jgi:hypothetical protein
LAVSDHARRGAVSGATAASNGRSSASSVSGRPRRCSISTVLRRGWHADSLEVRTVRRDLRSPAPTTPADMLAGSPMSTRQPARCAVAPTPEQRPRDQRRGFLDRRKTAGVAPDSRPLLASGDAKAWSGPIETNQLEREHARRCCARRLSHRRGIADLFAVRGADVPAVGRVRAGLLKHLRGSDVTSRARGGRQAVRPGGARTTGCLDIGVAFVEHVRVSQWLGGVGAHPAGSVRPRCAERDSDRRCLPLPLMLAQAEVVDRRGWERDGLVVDGACGVGRVLFAPNGEDADRRGEVQAQAAAA